jgi:AcrR family transcriptional regulator
MAKRAEAREARESKKNAIRSPDRTREALLLAAKRLFALRGFDGVSVKELAEAAGVNVSLVSYHFEGKLGLYRTCIGQFGRERLAVAERILQEAKTREEFGVRLELFLEEVTTCHLSEPELSSLVHRECELAVPLIPDIFEDTFLQIFARLMAFLKNGQKRGYCRSEIDTQLAAGYLMGSLFDLFRSDAVAKKYFGRTIADPDYRKKTISTLVTLFLGGFAS